MKELRPLRRHGSLLLAASVLGACARDESSRSLVPTQPLDNRKGSNVPSHEGATLSYLPHLLTTQTFILPMERTEAAGCHFPGPNEDLRGEVVRCLNADVQHRRL